MDAQCDKSLPECLVCIKAGRQCPGYTDDKARAFVNFDSSNILAPGKRVAYCRAIAQSRQAAPIHYQDPTPSNVQKMSVSFEPPPTSTVSSWSTQTLDIAPLNQLQTTAIHALEFTASDFRQHFEALWGGFQSKYSRTDDYWPPGYSQLAQRNKALDLALIALSARRLAFSQGWNQHLNLLSLTAYDKALKLFISLIQCRDGRGVSSAILAVTSTVFSLLEGSQMQIEQILDQGWRWSKHLSGALELVRQSGAEVFSVGGFHLVFKKVREMGLALAVVRRSKTFLSLGDWMSKPWFSHSRTWRDILYDYAARFSEITACEEEREEAISISGDSRYKVSIRQIEVSDILSIEKGLGIWRQEWLKKEHPHVLIQCTSQCEPSPCVCSMPAADFPTNDFALLQVEYWSLQLLVSLELTKLHANRISFGGGVDTSPGIPRVLARSAFIARSVEETLVLPVFGQSEAHYGGLTEGLCRTIMPSWILRLYKAHRQEFEWASPCIDC